MKVLVTGGTGYIGSHTVVELQKEGHEVLIIDSLVNSHIQVLDNIKKISGVKPTFIQLDLCQIDDLRSALKDHDDITSVIHFAAHKAVGESVVDPLKYYGNNLFSLINLLTVMKEKEILSIIFSSSCTVYGEPDSLPVTEKSPIKLATSPYGNTKQIAEEILLDVVNASQTIKCISLRYFNPIGAHASSLIGELPIGTPNNLLPFICQVASGVRPQLNVFGDDYNTPDGSCIRDYIHVVDLAKAHISAMMRHLQNSNAEKFESFNIGTGRGYSVLELIDLFQKATGQKINYKIDQRRSGDVEKIYADTFLANKELNWKAESSIEHTLQTAWNWEKNYRSGNSFTS